MTPIESFLQATRTFANNVRPLFPEFQIDCYEPITAKHFHQRYKELNTGVGVYLFVAPESGRVLYVGESLNIYGRFLQHIGRGYRFGEHDECFPNFGLAVMYHWAQDETKKVLKSGNFYVHALEVEPPEMRWLLESFLIAYGRSHKIPSEFNVEG